MVARAAAGDEPARRIWNQAIEALALSLADAIGLLDPERVVIGADAGARGMAVFIWRGIAKSASSIPGEGS